MARRTDPKPMVTLLGQVDVTVDGHRAPLGGPKQRAVLAMLSLDAGRVVPSERLIDGVWGDDAPNGVRSVLQVNISQLRKALSAIGTPATIHTEGLGYRLDCAGDDVDVARFVELARQAGQIRHTDDAASLPELALEALSLWTGTPLSGVGSAPFARAIATRLEEQRLDLIEAAADAALATGTGDAVVEVVERLALDNPFRESLWERLARLLYRDGRQADALDRLAVLRRTLLDELGLDPNPAIGLLETAILNQDPSLPTRSAQPVNTSLGRSTLPVPPLLLGRAELIEAVSAELSRARLVTLTGPGGVGKTSLAMEIITRVQPSFPDGVFYVPLAGVHDPQLMLGVVAGELLPRGARLADISAGDLVAALGSRRVLICLDNCEHLLDGAADIATALSRAANVAILATSQAPLEAAGESVIVVASLDIDAAVELFIKAGQLASKDFAPDVAERSQIVELCRRLDGIPLAIELLAARVRTYSADELSEHLDRVELPTRRGGDSRHHSMRAAIEWSYSLLDPGVAAFVDRFSIFEGGCDTAAALHVCATAGDDAAAVHAALDTAVARSLIERTRTASGIRFRMLEPIRAVAREHLESVDGSRPTGRRLVERVTAWGGQVKTSLISADPRPAISSVLVEAGNIRAAYRFCTDAGDHLAAITLITSFGPLGLSASGAIPELERWLRDLIVHIDDVDEATRLQLLLTATWCIEDQYDLLEPLAQEAYELAARLDDSDSLMFAAGRLGEMLVTQDIARSEQTLGGALGDMSGPANAVYQAAALNMYVNILIRRADYQSAQRMLDRALATGSERFGLLEANLLYQVGRNAAMQGDTATARAQFDLSQQAANHTGSPFGMSYALSGYASLSRAEGDLVGARSMTERMLDISRSVAPREAMYEVMQLAQICSEMGDVAAATIYVEELRVDPSRRAMGLYHSAAGWLSIANGHGDIAIDHLIAAAQLFVESSELQRVSEVLGALSRCVDGGNRALLDAGAKVLAGGMTGVEALSVIAAAFPERGPSAAS